MASVEDDIQLIRDLIAWTDGNAKRVADSIGVVNTTINRFANGSAKTRLGRETLSKLQARYPDFPGFATTPPANSVPFKYEGASFEDVHDDLPVVGTALGASRRVDGEAIEQTDLNSGRIEEYVKRPVMLNRKPKAYGLHVQGSSMHPALPDGELIVAVPEMPVSIGDNVVVYLRPDGANDDGDSARAVLVKELVKRSASFYELRQYDPPLVFRVPQEEVLRVDRVLTRKEMLS